MDLWAYTHTVILDFSRRGKPTDNAAIDSFNGRVREECLNVHWFQSLEDAQQKINAFRWDYNEHHPHRALKGLSPAVIRPESDDDRRRLAVLVDRKTGPLNQRHSPVATGPKKSGRSNPRSVNLRDPRESAFR
jgi:hypothetical protein